MLCNQPERESCAQNSFNNIDRAPERENLSSTARNMRDEDAELNQLQPIIYALLKNSDIFGLESRTKFLAYNYVLRFVKKFPCFLNQNQELLIITCLRLAVKFQERAQISNAYNLESCVVQGQGKYCRDDFILMEIKVVQALEYRLNTVTPYDYLEDIGLKLGLDDRKQEIIQAAIDYMLSLIWTPSLTAEQIFTCCFLACYEGVNIQHLNLFNTLNRMYKKFPTIRNKALLIREQIFKMDEENSESQPNTF